MIPGSFTVEMQNYTKTSGSSDKAKQYADVETFERLMHIRMSVMCESVDNLNLNLVSSLYQDASGRHRLLIEWVTKSDAGWYTFSAINAVGMSSCNARLDVGSKTTLSNLFFLLVAA